jgi:pilus assembly protein CpaB
VVGAVGLAFFAGRRQGAPAAPERRQAFVPEFHVVEVPVPNRPVSAGTVVRDIPVRMEKFPEHQLPADVVRDLGGLRDQVTLVALPGGLPIVRVNIGDTDEASNPLVGKIGPGMRAMTVKVDATTAVEGWARGGSIVDVLLVEKDRTSVVAERVRILSAERSLAATAPESSLAVPSTVTLLVTQEQCLAINTAISLGKISFALRSRSDDAGWRSTEFGASDLARGDSPKAAPRVRGAVSIGSGAAKKTYALMEGRWIPADEAPSGFLIGEKARSGGQ